MEKNYLASIKEINATIVEIEFSKIFYSCYKLSASDTTQSYRNCTIVNWNSENEYKAIHNLPKLKPRAAK